MILTEKTGEVYSEIESVSNRCFKWPEAPATPILRHQFDNGDVFVRPEPVISAYAIVTREAGYPFLWSIAVDEWFRNVGIGARLLKEIITFYQDKHEERIDLTVNVNNPAQKLYFDHGWRALRVLPKYYGPQSGLRMRRIL